MNPLNYYANKTQKSIHCVIHLHEVLEKEKPISDNRKQNCGCFRQRKRRMPGKGHEKTF